MEETMTTENKSTMTTKPPVTAEPVRSAGHRVGDDGWTGRVLVAALVAMALVTGLIYTFAVAVMPNLADADDRTFVETMQRFNDNPAFMLTFAGALVLTVVAAVLQRRQGPSVATRWTVAALVLYGIVLVVTFAINIPLNDDIDQAGDRVAEFADVRDDFETPWVVSNIVRTVFSTAAVAALGWALFLQGRRAAARNAGARAGGP
jgi:uncharacterized membrane protein